MDSAQVSNMSVDWVGYGYATLVASGGVLGYVKAGVFSIRSPTSASLLVIMTLKSFADGLYHTVHLVVFIIHKVETRHSLNTPVCFLLHMLLKYCRCQVQVFTSCIIILFCFFLLGSVPSLAAGLLFGGLAGFGAYQISNDPNNIWVSLATSGALSAVMGKRFYGSRKFMPAGLMAGASILMVGKLSLALLQKPAES
uniref:Transmembrane protein 14C n=2 Tax=Acanthochromis polyacanthus TaxID=80966 RepID=A0A3Q1HMD6_9TELE